MTTEQNGGQEQRPGDSADGTGKLSSALKYSRLENTLSLLCFPFAVWLIVFPRPHIQLALANLAAPLAALLLVRISDGAGQVDGGSRTVPAAGFVLFLPAGAVLYDVFISYQLVYSKILLPALAASVVLTALFRTLVGGRLRTPGSWGRLLLAAKVDVCLYRRRGLLGIPWSVTGFCESH